MLKNIIATVSGLVLGGLFILGSANADTYQVQAGDTLSEIASVKGTTVEEIASVNNIQDVNVIFEGEVFTVNGGSATIELKGNPEPIVAVVADENTPVTPAQEPTTDVTVTTAPVVGAMSSAKEVIAGRESSGSYTAQNGRYYGRYQLDSAYLNGDFSEANQEKVADEYVMGRYGSWDAALAFWNANGWY